jgi:hypothetical protein
LSAGPEKESGEIIEAPLVSPADPKRVLEVMRRFEEFKRQALNQNDFVVLEIGKEKKPYIKKSGWMKYALACQLSLEKRDERLEERSDGSKVYHYTYRAVAPNGRYADAVGSASTSERTFAHPDHDVRALAQTRACNRAISNLVAGGEVSAEEMVSEIHEGIGTSSSADSPVPRKQSPGETQVWRVPITKDQGSPEQIKQGVKQHPLLKEITSFGMLNVLDEECSIVPEKPVPVNTALIDGFLVRKILQPMKSKHERLQYTVQADSKGMLQAVLIRGKLEEQQIKDLASAATWAFKRAMEKD